MEYSAGNVSNLFWFVETRETSRLLQLMSEEEVQKKIVEENIYQQRQQSRIKNEWLCIRRRLMALPSELREYLVVADLTTAKIIIFLSIMATDRLLFEFVYEVYRDKLIYGAEQITDSDFQTFFANKCSQNEKVAGWSDEGRSKLKRTYSKYFMEAGLLQGTPKNRMIARPYVDEKIRTVLKENEMLQYLLAITGEN